LRLGLDRRLNMVSRRGSNPPSEAIPVKPRAEDSAGRLEDPLIADGVAQGAEKGNGENKVREGAVSVDRFDPQFG
jgi:hypothetical protein